MARLTYLRRRHATFGLSLLALSALTGCFPEPDLAKLACDDNQQCPSGYLCRVPGRAGGCCKPDDLTCGQIDAAASDGLDAMPTTTDATETAMDGVHPPTDGAPSTTDARLAAVDSTPTQVRSIDAADDRVGPSGDGAADSRGGAPADVPLAPDLGTPPADAPPDLKPTDTPTTGIADCDPLTNPANGSVIGESTKPGSTATYACSIGYRLSQSVTRTCQPDGTWSGAAPTCSLVDCGPLSAPTSGSVSATITTYGSIANYSCATGYGPSGSSTRTCQANGIWSGTAPSCVASDCPSLPEPTGGTVSAPTLTVGSTATYSCGTGHQMHGTATRTCQADRTWAGTAPTCTIIDCGPPPALANGAVSAPITTYGSTATYSCTATGYHLSGNATRTCQADISWSGTAPTCVLVDCGAPLAPTNGTVSAPITTYGSTATYSCTTTGYHLSGSATRTCQADSSWGTAPTCVLVDCGGLSAPANGTVDVPGTTYGSQATYACHESYVLSGSATTSCQASGEWSTPAPTCGCPAGNTPCNGTCIDVQSDNGNCGSCNTICSTTSPSLAQCTAGRCLVTLASAQAAPTGLTVDSHHVYWNTFGTAGGPTGTTMKVPIGGGPSVTIASGQLNPYGIAVDANNVYWTNDPYIMKSPIGSSAPTPFASEQDQPAFVATDGTNVYWSNMGHTPDFLGSLMKMSAGGTSPTTLISGATYGDFVVTATNRYWSEITHGAANSGKVMKKALDGTLATPLASSLPFPSMLAVDAFFVYWTSGEDHTLRKVSSAGDGSLPTLLASQVSQYGLATDGTWVYFATTTGSMVKMSVDGSSTIPLATGQTSSFWITIDSNSLYWTTETNPGAVMKLTPR